MNPYLLAFFASVCFGVVVFPWKATIGSLGTAGVFLPTGAVYLLAGAVFYLRDGFVRPPTPATAGIALVMALIYVTALVLCTYAFGHPAANLAIAAAITAAYPLITAGILLARGQRFSVAESAFFLMAVIGVVGLGLFSGGTR